MSLNDDERKEIIKYRLGKVNDTFAEIPVLMDNKSVKFR